MAKIIITRFDEVVDTIESDTNIVAVLSIEHPGVRQGEIGAAPLINNLPQKILSFWDAEQKMHQGPDLAQVEAGLLFAVEHIQKGNIIIHCKAGKARSTAMALGVMSIVYPRMKEEELIDKLIEMRPEAAPNILVVEMVDKLSGRNGKLLQAVLKHSKLNAQREKAEESRKRYLANNPELYKKLFPEKRPK